MYRSDLVLQGEVLVNFGTESQELDVEALNPADTMIEEVVAV